MVKSHENYFGSGMFVIACIVLFFCICAPVYGSKTIASPFNSKVLHLSETPQNYSFFVAGHVYGSPSTPRLPAATFLANIDMINKNNPKFFVFLGDAFYLAQEKYIGSFNKLVSRNIDAPIFNAVGNHDGSNRTLYKKYYGQTYFDFRCGSELFIVLDSQVDNGEIVGEQFDYLVDVLDRAGGDESVKNVFIFSHHLIWSAENSELAIVYAHTNAHACGQTEKSNFKSVVLPEIISLSGRKNIYFVSGDIGTTLSLPLFYHEDSKYNITYVASGISDLEWDAIIRVDVSEEGQVVFVPVSLTDEELEEMAYYGVDYWRDYYDYRDWIFYKIYKLLARFHFQLGVAFTLVVMSLFAGGLILFKRFRR